MKDGWFTHDPARSYSITCKGEPFQGHDISLESLAGLIAKIATTPDLQVRDSIGVSDR